MTKPNAVDPSNLFLKVVQSPRAATQVDFTLRGLELQALIRPLTEDENVPAIANATERTRSLFKNNPIKKDEADSSYESIHNKFWVAEILSRSFYRIDEPTKKFFPSPNEITSNLTVSEIELLFHKYLIVQAECSPMNLFEAGSDLDEWLDRFEKAGSLHPLGSLGWGSVTLLVSAMVKRLLSSRNSKSSPGLLHEDSFSESKMESPVDPSEEMEPESTEPL